MCVDLRLSTSATLLSSFQEVTPLSYPQHKSNTNSVAIMALNNLDQLTEFLHLSHEDLEKLEDHVRQAVRAEMQDLKDKIAKAEDTLETVTLENNYLRSNSSPEVLASLPSNAQLPDLRRLRSLKEKAADPGVQP